MRREFKMNIEQKKVIVVGGGLAGLAAAMKIAEQGIKAIIVSVTNCKRSHSVCAQGGINAAMNLCGEDDSPTIHAYDTIKGGDFLADQPPIVEMCFAAPSIIRMLDRFGCPFNRTPEGNMDFRRFGGTLYNRTAFCGATTGQQLLYALDEQVRKYESKGLVEKYEFHEFLRIIQDEEGNARGVVVHDLFNLKLTPILADAVVLATGGPGLIFKKSTNSTFCSGAANGRAFMQGMHYANPEFIQIHPTAIPGKDKMRLMSESARGEGGRVWVYGDSRKTIKAPDGKEVPCGITGQPWYFLEELYPAFGNLVPRDIGAREIMRVCELGLGIDGKMEVYLDVSHLKKETIDKLLGILEIYEKFTGSDPRKVPMKIYPAVHYSMGGGWVDWPAADDSDRWDRYRQMTNLKGLFNIGESDYQFHGANRLGANSLLSCIFSGLVVGVELPRFFDQEVSSYKPLEDKYINTAITTEEEIRDSIFNNSGKESIYDLHNELADLMVQNVTVKRNNKDLSKTLDAVLAIRDRYKNVGLKDNSRFANRDYVFIHQFKAMIELAIAIVLGALKRDESRGAHYKPEAPARDDKSWLKTTVAHWHNDLPVIDYKDVDLRHLDPIQRDYTTAKKVKPTLKNMPEHMPLPV